MSEQQQLLARDIFITLFTNITSSIYNFFKHLPERNRKDVGV